MADISAKDVKALREETGAGMMDCKNALKDAEGDPKKAVELLRERGLSKAGKRAGRATSEGTVGFAIAGADAAIVELGCETDFVAKTDDFQGLAQRVADVVASDASIDDAEKALAAKLGDGSVDETIKATVARVGENIELKRVGRVSAGQGVAGGYIHAGGKLGVVVALGTASGGENLGALAKDVCMHVAAVDPTPVAVDRDGVPSDVVESEKSILRKQAEQSGKPEKVIEKIVEGRINKFYSEHCLLEQGFVRDPDKTVGQMLGEAGDEVAVAGFVRFKLGEAS